MFADNLRGDPCNFICCVFVSYVDGRELDDVEKVRKKKYRKLFSIRCQQLWRFGIIRSRGSKFSLDRYSNLDILNFVRIRLFPKGIINYNLPSVYTMTKKSCLLAVVIVSRGIHRSAIY